jgi:hypothetical protein
MDELGRGLSQATIDGSLYERCIKNIEAGVLGEFKDRFSQLDAALERIMRKTNLALETAAGSAKRVDKVEEGVAQLSYIKTRVESNEGKFERLYELDAVVQALKVGVVSLETNIGVVRKDAAEISAEHKKTISDFESVSHQLNQLTALFNHFRTQLSFLLPKKESLSDK